MTPKSVCKLNATSTPFRRRKINRSSCGCSSSLLQFPPFVAYISGYGFQQMTYVDGERAAVVEVRVRVRALAEHRELRAERSEVANVLEHHCRIHSNRTVLSAVHTFSMRTFPHARRVKTSPSRRKDFATRVSL
eukprot:1453996-Rhodomonas_salina.1